MKILLKILGDELFDRVTRELAAANSAFPRRLSPANALNWQIRRLEAPMCPDYLYDSPDHASVLLIGIQDPSDIESLWSIGSREYPVVRIGESGNEPSAVILVFNNLAESFDVMGMPWLVSDWVCGNDEMHELARRIIATLRRQESLQEDLAAGQLMMHLETRRLIYNGDSVQLSPAEMPLAELFMAHLGSVIPIEEIHLIFRLSGRSITGSNIRVTIYQLRFKIELLTNHHFTIACAYGEGYTLRPGKWGDAPRFPVTEARQSSVVQYN
jgi:DNA-binding response OmpR family regulator